MKRKIAGILALCLFLTGCGSMPEQIDSEELEQRAEMLVTETEEEAEEETETERLSAEAKETDATTPRSTEEDAADTSKASQPAASGTVTSPQNVGTGPYSGGNASHSGENTSQGGGNISHSGGTSSHGGSNKPSGSGTGSGKSTTPQTSTEKPPAPTQPPVTTQPAVVTPPASGGVPTDGTTQIINGIMVTNSGTDHPRAIELFSGNKKTAERYAQTLNSYKTALGDAVNVYCMVVPTSQAFYTPADYAGQYGNQQEYYNLIASGFAGVAGVPVYETLDAHKAEPLYSRTDYHWQPLGAYYAAQQFAATAGVEYADLSTYTPVTREGYKGAFCNVNKISLTPEQFTYYKPANLDSITCTYYDTAFNNGKTGSLFFENNGISSSYTVFVGRDDCILQVDTDAPNERVLVIFKDSYGNALVPFLTQSFKRIYLCDFRYFDRNAVSFMQEVGATDLLFALSTVACCTSSKVDKVAGNLTK